jgi:hypothetical protein
MTGMRKTKAIVAVLIFVVGIPILVLMSWLSPAHTVSDLAIRFDPPGVSLTSDE